MAQASAVARQVPEPSPGPGRHQDPVPAAGTVQVLDGPFVDRVVLDGLALTDGRLTGELDVVSDVSELLALELDITWYDAGGVLVGAVREVVDPAVAEEFHTSAGLVDLPIEVAVPGAVSATVAVPVLVNE